MEDGNCCLPGTWLWGFVMIGLGLRGPLLSPQSQLPRAKTSRLAGKDGRRNETWNSKSSIEVLLRRSVNPEPFFQAQRVFRSSNPSHTAFFRIEAQRNQPPTPSAMRIFRGNYKSSKNDIQEKAKRKGQKGGQCSPLVQVSEAPAQSVAAVVASGAGLVDNQAPGALRRLLPLRSSRSVFMSWHWTQVRKAWSARTVSQLSSSVRARFKPSLTSHNLASSIATSASAASCGGIPSSSGSTPAPAVRP